MLQVGRDIEGLNLPKLYETGRPRGFVACKVGTAQSESATAEVLQSLLL